MNADELRATLRGLQIRQVHLAELLGVSPHTVNRWICGRKPVPQYVALILSLLAERKAADNRAEIAATVAPRLRELLAQVETLNNAP
jgi:DNA-binding transcriptional regulator YdaS (Cro superfamily)